MKRLLSLLLIIYYSALLNAQPITGFTEKNAEIQRALEKQFLAIPNALNNKRYLLKLTEEPHIAGSPQSKAVAEYILSKYRAWGLDAKLVEYWAYLPYPQLVKIALLEPDTLKFKLQEPSWRFDKDSYDKRAVMPFNAYSPSGNVTAQVVYVNRGLPEDYEKLEELGIDIGGKIALVRYGGSFRGVKAQVAEEHGAAGLIIYSDPADDGYMRGDIYPYGPLRPSQAIQRGSLQYLFKYPGDPLTPGWAAHKNARRLKPEEATNMPHIPTAPISYGEARRILQSLAGPEVPENSWQGGLPFRYHVGPGPAKIHMQLKMDYKIRPIYDVLVTIPGIEEPAKKVIVGNHHDAWVYGAVDPNSGTSVVLETGRALAQLLKNGWHPKRTIILAHWDAEEYGLIGSTEWVEEHREDLSQNAVIYINIDAAVSGQNFNANAVPSLDKFIQEVVKEITDPATGMTVFERWWKRLNPREYKRLGKVVPDTASTKVGRLGSGSDYTAFLHHVGVPSLMMNFGGRYGVYHSILDNFFWMKSWGDPTFKYHETMSKIVGLTVLRFAQADILPFDYAHYADTVVRHLNSLNKSLHKKFLSVPLDFTKVINKAQLWKQAADSLNQIISKNLMRGQISSTLNDRLMQIERTLLGARGLPGREWFKHRVYAPGFYTGYAAKPIPGVAEPAEQGNWRLAQQELEYFEKILEKVIQQTREAARGFKSANSQPKNQNK
ncbi:MAG: M28 family peptidase [Calditrichaeota bacterium]|nr:MAG: M28 family peptidase [Calditrichota bacterium]